MADREKTADDDALYMIVLRNEFYKKKYHSALGIFFLSLFAILVLVGMLVYLIKHPAHPIYFVGDTAGRFVQNIPLSDANMPVADVTAWAVEAVEAAYTYDFVNYRSQLQNSQKYFTEYGWRNFMKGLQASNNLEALTQRKLVATAKVIAPPKLIKEGLVGQNKVHTWLFEMPVIVSYLPPPYDGKGKFDNPLIISVRVGRQDELSSYKGLGIDQLIGSIAQEPAT